jgi:hypothetical protein
MRKMVWIQGEDRTGAGALSEPVGMRGTASRMLLTVAPFLLTSLYLLLVHPGPSFLPFTLL